MGLFSHLFFMPHEQIRRCTSDNVAHARHLAAKEAAEAVPDVALSRQKSRALRLDRCELVLEALFRYLQDKGQIDIDEFTRYVQMIDLEDGLEDGRIGADRREHAPKCPMCEKPHNPTRSKCIYCGLDIPEDNLAEMKPLGEYKYVVCVSCFRRVPEDRSKETMQGHLCRRCSG